MPWNQPWLTASIGLYALAIACWLPVVGIQLHLRDEARRNARAPAARCPPKYWRLFKAWVALGAVAFVAFLAIFWLMVTKPRISAPSWKALRPAKARGARSFAPSRPRPTTTSC
jgi:uncharacterized membrane protein